jgi:hypothetical protein
MSTSAEFKVSTIFGTRIHTLAVPAGLYILNTGMWVDCKKDELLDEYKAPDGGGCTVTLLGFVSTKVVHKLGSLAALI